MKALLLAALLLGAAPAFANPEGTAAFDDAAQQCMAYSSRTVFGQCVRDAQLHGLAVGAEANRQRAEQQARQQAHWDAIPVGRGGTGAYVNGVEISKCSHGGLCLGQMLDAMRRGY